MVQSSRYDVDKAEVQVLSEGCDCIRGSDRHAQGEGVASEANTDPTAPFLSLFPDDPGLNRALEPSTNIPSISKMYRCPGDPDAVYSLTLISYTYNASLSGRPLDASWFRRRLNFHESEIPVAYDCDGNSFVLDDGSELPVAPFHTKRNVLFADAHVGDFE